MPKWYVPKPISPDFDPTPVDLDYAEAFSQIAKLLDKSKNSEKLTLRLSTCRNLYLTINALFVSLRHVLGHGRLPSPLSRAIEHLRRGEFKQCVGLIGDVQAALSSFDLKRAVWNERVELDDEVERLLEKLELATQSRIRRILENVRTKNTSGYQRWHRKYYELSREESAWALERLQLLERTRERISGIQAAIKTIVEWPSETGLFPDDPREEWGVLHRTLKDSVSQLEFSINPDTECVSWPAPTGGVSSFPCDYPGQAGASEAITSLVERLSEIERDLYSSVAQTFPPNLGTPPLPDPYVIDLTEPSLVERETAPSVVIESHDCGVPPEQEIRIAMLGCGIPLEFYDKEKVRYRSDDLRRKIRELAIAAIRTAKAEGAAAVVL